MDAKPEEDCTVWASCSTGIDAAADDPARAAEPSEAILKMTIDAYRLSK
jgi:hypothetical protein